VVVIPREALHGDRVYLVREGRLHISRVEVLALEPQVAVIRRGIEPGDLVVLTDLFPASEGMVLRASVVENPVQPRLEINFPADVFERLDNLLARRSGSTSAAQSGEGRSGTHESGGKESKNSGSAEGQSGGSQSAGQLSDRQISRRPALHTAEPIGSLGVRAASANGSASEAPAVSAAGDSSAAGSLWGGAGGNSVNGQLGETAANLLMLVFILVGLLGLSGLQREVFPEFTSDFINIQVLYRGASADEVEQTICRRIEEELESIEGIEEVVSTARENLAYLVIEVADGYNVGEVLDDVENAVDQIDTFPEDAEDPIVWQFDSLDPVCTVTLWAERMPIKDLVALAEQIRREMLDLDGVSLVNLTGFSDHQIR